MPQFFVSPENLDARQFRITGDEARHVIRVLRMQPHDRVILFDGSGRRAEGILTAVDEKSLVASGDVVKTLPPAPKPVLVRLLQGLPRGSKFDYVIEKATELGVDEIVPFLSEKNPIRLNAAQEKSKRERWTRLAEAAAKQSAREGLPGLSPVLSMDDLKPFFQEPSVVLWEKDSRPLREALQSAAASLKSRSRPSYFNIIVGPESGFSPPEIKRLVEAGVQTASLGRRILRTETAALAALAIVNYEWDLS